MFQTFGSTVNDSISKNTWTCFGLPTLHANQNPETNNCDIELLNHRNILLYPHPFPSSMPICFDITHSQHLFLHQLSAIMRIHKQYDCRVYATVLYRYIYSLQLIQYMFVQLGLHLSEIAELIIQITQHSKSVMKQRTYNTPKTSTKRKQPKNKKQATKVLTETPVKQNAAPSQLPFSSYLQPLPLPPKTDSWNLCIYGSNQSFSNEIQEIYTPIVKQPSKLTVGMHDQPLIISRIIFQDHSSEDVQNNASSEQSYQSEESASKSSSQRAQGQMFYFSPMKQQSGQPSWNINIIQEKGPKSVSTTSNAPRISNDKNKLDQEKRIYCNCRRSKCLKLYCDCFRVNQTCNGCNCQGCHNIEQYDAERSLAILTLMDKKPDPFGQKIEGNKHLKGCNCKKSNCLKKYCECYQAGLKCGLNCRCEQCKNIQEVTNKYEEEPSLLGNTAKKEKKMVEM